MVVNFVKIVHSPNYCFFLVNQRKLLIFGGFCAGCLFAARVFLCPLNGMLEKFLVYDRNVPSWNVLKRVTISWED